MHVMYVCVDQNLCAAFVYVMCVWRMMCACKMCVLQCGGMILDQTNFPAVTRFYPQPKMN